MILFNLIDYAPLYQFLYPFLLLKNYFGIISTIVLGTFTQIVQYFAHFSCFLLCCIYYSQPYAITGQTTQDLISLNFADDIYIVFIVISKVVLKDHANRIKIVSKDNNALIDDAMCMAKLITNTDETLQVVIEAGDRKQRKYFINIRYSRVMHSARAKLRSN